MSCPQWRKKSRVFDDPCAVQVRERQSIDHGDYKVTNFFRRCNEPVMTDCMLNQSFNYPKVHGINRCNTNLDSKFRYAPLTNLNNIHQLQTKPYTSLGYRGAGANQRHLTDLESNLIQGNAMTTYKGCEKTNGVYIDRWDYLPKANQPQRIDRVIPPWTRGGVLSRQLIQRLSLDDHCHMLNKARPY